MENIPSNQKAKKKLSRTAKLFNSFSKKNPFANKEIFTINCNPRRHGTFHKKSKFPNISLMLFDDLNNLDLLNAPLSEKNEKFASPNNRISMINPSNNFPDQKRKSSLPGKTQKERNFSIVDEDDIITDKINLSTEIKSKLKFSKIYDNNDDNNNNFIRMNSHPEKKKKLSKTNPFKDPILRPPDFNNGSRLDELWKYEVILIEYNIIDFTCNLIFMLFF